MIKKTSILIVLSLFLVCCKTAENSINIKFSTSNEDVTLFYSNKVQAIHAISLPFDLEIENPSSKKLTFRNFSYFYGSANANRGIKLFLKKDGQLVKQSFSKLKNINSRQTNSYLVRSKHSVDSTMFSMSFFKDYIEEMKRLNQDTLNIGTISELKVKHKELLDNLLQNDSISFLFLDENSETGFRKKTKSVEY